MASLPLPLPLPLPRHTETPTLPATPTASASARLLRPGGRLRLGFVSCRATAQTLAAAAPDASGLDLAHCRHASVAAPSPRASTRRPDGSSFLVLAVSASADCKRAAECLERSFDSTREKLPETMASVRLVGREISDLSLDLSDLSQELRKVVRSSMSIVHTADAQLHQLTTSAPQGTAQRRPNGKKAVGEPLLASTVRELRELIADIRSGFGAAFGMASLFMWASNFDSKRPKNRS